MMPYNAAFNLAAQLAELQDAQQSIPGTCASSVHSIQLEPSYARHARRRAHSQAMKRPLGLLRRLLHR